MHSVFKNILSYDTILYLPGEYPPARTQTYISCLLLQL